MRPIPATALLEDLPKDDPRWAAVVGRDRTADGRFFYAVRTTGVYCRPSCGARLARRENVSFHLTPAEAERAGFRPCKRCKPDQLLSPDQRAVLITAACRTIEAAESAPTLAELARQAGLSSFHFHRLFKAVTGLTPRAYAAARRVERVRDQLTDGAPVTRALLDAGYGSNSRFYAQSDRVLGMTPGAYRNGGRDEEIRFAVTACALGALLVGATAKGICAVSLGDDEEILRREFQQRFPHARLVGDDPAFVQWVTRVVEYVEDPGVAWNLPLDIRGTAFQQRVWQALQEIPSGTTISYTDLAARIGRPNAVRAVASACAANTVAVIIPCHRVVRSDGTISGYRWGPARKRALLRRESEG